VVQTRILQGTRTRVRAFGTTGGTRPATIGGETRLKRHPSLEAFSRDHHVAFVVARWLKRALETTAEEARIAFLSYWRSQGREHSREEEEILLPTFAAFADPDAPVVAEFLIDHVRIR